jgi:vacuolar-type H+-ATPase subunit I/STV1
MTNVLVAPGEATRHSELSAPLDLNAFRQEDTRWRPIGEVLVAAGAITREELQEELDEQRHSGKRLGEVLIEAGRISWLSLAQAIADQTNASESRREQFVDAAAFAPPTTTPEFPSVAEAVGTQDPEAKLRAVESLLRERQRAFIELVSTTELLRRQVAQLEARLAERNDELARLRQSARKPS